MAAMAVAEKEVYLIHSFIHSLTQPKLGPQPTLLAAVTVAAAAASTYSKNASKLDEEIISYLEDYHTVSRLRRKSQTRTKAKTQSQSINQEEREQAGKNKKKKKNQSKLQSRVCNFNSDCAFPPLLYFFQSFSNLTYSTQQKKSAAKISTERGARHRRHRLDVLSFYPLTLLLSPMDVVVLCTSLCS